MMSYRAVPTAANRETQELVAATAAVSLLLTCSEIVARMLPAGRPRGARAPPLYLPALGALPFLHGLRVPSSGRWPFTWTAAATPSTRRCLSFVCLTSSPRLSTGLPFLFLRGD